MAIQSPKLNYKYRIMKEDSKDQSDKKEKAFKPKVPKLSIENMFPGTESVSRNEGSNLNKPQSKRSNASKASRQS